MASIPLPALRVQTEQQSPLALYAQAQQIRNAQQEQQLRSTQIAGANLDVQQKQLQLQDSQTLRESAKGLDWSDPDTFDKWMQNAQKNGVSPQTMSALALQRAQYKEQLAKTDQQTLTTEKARVDQLLGHIDAVRGETEPAKRATVSQMQGQQILSSGLVKDPQTLQFVQAMANGQKVPTDSELNSFETGLQYHSANVSQELEQRKTAQGAWKELGSLGLLVNTESGKIISPSGGQMTPAMLESKYVGIQQKKNQGQSLTGDEQAFSKAYEKNKTLVPAFNFNVQNAGAATGPNGQPSDVVQGLASGQYKWNEVVSARTPMSVKNAIASEVKKLNPQFNTGDYAIEQAVKKEFTSGDAAKNLTAFNTAIEHANQLSTAADALNNSDLPTLNRIGNALGYQFGSDKKTNFNVIKNALTGEISKVFKGGQATDAEIKAVQDPFNAANSPAQLKGAIQNAVQLMNSKRDALKQQYEQGVQAKPNFDSNQAQTQTAGAPKAPAGATHIGIGSVDKKKHYLDENQKDLGLAE